MKPETKDASVLPLQQFYTAIIVQMMNARQLTALQQEFENMADPSGRLYFVRDGTTVPEVIMEYVFTRDALQVKVLPRSGKVLTEVVSYAAGLDSFLDELAKFLNAGKLAAPKK